ncbi:methyltransferase domain-containing protein [Jatrophihabitans telluris]|uniref:Methyltransferase domain-containing protein n=1 Tax=Jatrophihabitans telluris TaxID=2038343 RepID=A0ABY4QZ46_9ACTN|nr:methyltransferase domain-containing protein [Jatrophihabitans telluris]UQX88185.1 methyltransferase domain-containing protein [Jatrophihabitans telluris]
MSQTYNFSYSPDNVYGHVVDLSLRYAEPGSVHLDLGCGHGAIAEVIRDAGYTYIGLDLDAEAVAHLNARGFEAHVADFSSPQTVLEEVEKHLDGRALGAVTMIDLLEHIVTGPDLLSRIQQLCAAHGPVPLTISVPNVTHRDVGIKLLTGRWDYTETGLLDHTHVRFYNVETLTTMMSNAGWAMVAERDFTMERSDQHFPVDSVALSTATVIGSFLQRIREHASPSATVNQFVRSYLPAKHSHLPNLHNRSKEYDYPLTVLMRTQGRRPQTLRDSLLCLSGQTDQDFDLIVLAHKTSADEQIVIEEAIDELPPSLRARTRLIVVNEGRRARPLNRGVAASRGRYVTILDDDDLVFAHWVETFRSLAHVFSGRLLRSVAVEQDIATATWSHDTKGFRTLSGTRAVYPTRFDLTQHLIQNHSPLMTWAFPRELFDELGQHFNEELPVCEDWDLIVRGALLCGVADRPSFTAIYRRWRDGADASHIVHTQAEWERAAAAIIAAIDDHPNLMPPGQIQRIRELAARSATPPSNREPELEADLARLREENADFRRIIHNYDRRVRALEGSTSWRVTTPLRRISALGRGVAGKVAARPHERQPERGRPRAEDAAPRN